MQKCSSYSKCCCDQAEDWTEDTCHSDGGQEIIKKGSQKGTMESWKKQKETYSNKDLMWCQRPDSVKFAYQTGPYAAQTTAGCCLRTEQRTYSERYVCGHHSVQYSDGTYHEVTDYC